MTIRKLTENDIGALTELQERYFADGWTAGMLESSFKTGRFFGYGLFDGEKLICFATATKGLDAADIEDVLTHPEHRGKGYASELLRRIICELKSDGIKKVFLEVRESNACALELYKKLGFCAVSVRKGYYPDGENAAVMCKEI